MEQSQGTELIDREWCKFSFVRFLDWIGLSGMEGGLGRRVRLSPRLGSVMWMKRSGWRGRGRLLLRERERERERERAVVAGQGEGEGKVKGRGASGGSRVSVAVLMVSLPCGARRGRAREREREGTCVPDEGGRGIGELGHLTFCCGLELWRCRC